MLNLPVNLWREFKVHPTMPLHLCSLKKLQEFHHSILTSIASKERRKNWRSSLGAHAGSRCDQWVSVQGIIDTPFPSCARPSRGGGSEQCCSWFVMGGKTWDLCEHTRSLASFHSLQGWQNAGCHSHRARKEEEGSARLNLLLGEGVECFPAHSTLSSVTTVTIPQWALSDPAFHSCMY